MKMSDSVKYQIEKAESALRTALKLLTDSENVYVISAISKALVDLDAVLFVERIEKAAKKGDPVVQGLSTAVKFDEHMGVFSPYTYYTESRTDYNSTGGVNVTL